MVKYFFTELTGGLRVVTCEMEQSTSVAMGLWVGVGGRDETAESCGIAHFVEHMLFKGTGRRSARRIMEEVEGVGGELNAFTGEERTCYYAVAAAEYFPRVCDVLCDIYTASRFPPDEVERERGVIIEEIQMYRDEPASHVQDLLNGLFWKGHALGRPLTGTCETVSQISQANLLDFWRSHYTAERTVVSVAGNVRHAEVVERVSRALEDLTTGGGGRGVAGGRRKPRVFGGVVAEQRDTQQMQVAVAFPGPSCKDRRRYAANLLQVILGGNASSRLFQQMRERRGLCYSVHMGVNFFSDCGAFNISAGLDAKNLEKSLKLVKVELEKIREQKPGAAELRRAKEYLIGSGRLMLERASAQSARAGSTVLLLGKLVDPQEDFEKIRAVQAEEVSEVAREFFDFGRAAIALVGPEQKEEAVRGIFF